jgi:tetratricopeptide (TPR) repeat protein
MFQRDLEWRNAAIEGMLNDLDDEEEHECYAIRVHSEKLDKLIALQERRIEDLRVAFVAEVRRMKEDHEMERADMIGASKALRTEILHFMRAIREDEEAKLSALEAEAAQNKEQQRRRALERIHALQTDMDSAIEILEKAFEEAHSRYLSNTDQRTQDFKTLSARGQHDTQMKERQRRAIKRLQLRLQYHQNKLAYLVREADDKNDALAVERDAIGRQLLALKVRWGQAQEVSSLRLKALAVAAKKAKAQLGEHLALASRILLAAETIRQLEPAEALVQPFPLIEPVAPEGGGLLVAVGTGPGAAGGTALTGSQVLPGSPIRAGAGGPGALSEVAMLESPHRGPDGAVEGFAGAGNAGRAPGSPAFAGEEGSVASIRSQLSVTTAGGDGPGVSASAGSASVSIDRSLMERMSDEPDVMTRFYDRFNRALVEKLALERKAVALREENATLQAMLRKCLAATTVTPGVVDVPNTLLVVNGRAGIPSNAHRAIPKAPVATVLVEAAYTVSNVSLHVGGRGR